MTDKEKNTEKTPHHPAGESAEYVEPKIKVHDKDELKNSTMIVHAGSLINP